MICNGVDCVEFFLGSEFRGDLLELPVTVVPSSKASMNGYWGPVVTWHLQFQVREMGYSHEFGKCGPAEDGVVLRFPVDYFELDLLFPEVVGRAEDHIQ